MKMNKLGTLCVSLAALMGVVSCNGAKFPSNLADVEYTSGEEAAPIREALMNKISDAVKNTSWEGVQYKGNDALTFHVNFMGINEKYSTIDGHFSHDTQLNVEINKENFTNKTYDDLLNLRMGSKVNVDLSLTPFDTTNSTKETINVDGSVVAAYGKSTLTISDAPKEDAYAFFGFDGSLQTTGQEKGEDTKACLLVAGLTSLIESGSTQIPEGDIDISQMLPEDFITTLQKTLNELIDQMGFAQNGNEFYVKIELEKIDVNKIMSNLLPSDVASMGLGVTLNGNLMAKITFDDNGALNSIETQLDDFLVKVEMQTVKILSLGGYSRASVTSYNDSVAPVSEEDLKNYNWNQKDNYLDLAKLFSSL